MTDIIEIINPSETLMNAEKGQDDWTLNPFVEGSNPSRPTNKTKGLGLTTLSLLLLWSPRVSAGVSKSAQCGSLPISTISPRSHPIPGRARLKQIAVAGGQSLPTPHQPTLAPVSPSARRRRAACPPVHSPCRTLRRTLGTPHASIRGLQPECCDA